MRFAKLAQLLRDRPFFEARELDHLFDEPRAQIQARISRWVRQGKLLRLRRGKYVLAEEYRRREPSLYYISNYLLRPSYVSLHSALEFHGMIPEAVGMVQAITAKHGREWITPLGAFRYRSIRQNRFWGYREYSTSAGNSRSRQGRFLMASGEKALLDLFYHDPGEWTDARIRGMRFQNLEDIDPQRFVECAQRFDSPKVARAAERLLVLLAEIGRDEGEAARARSSQPSPSK